MTRIEYNNQTIEVPEGWHEVRLRAYERYYTERPATLRDKVILVANICEIDVATILDWPADVFNIIAEKTAFIFQEHKATPAPSIKVNEVTYVIPIEEKLSLGAYIDADEVQKAGDRVLSQILAITCRPAGEAYNHELTEERAAMFGALSMEEVQPLLAFFLHYKDALDKNIAAYTNLTQAVESLPPNILSSLRLGGGTRLSRTWQTAKYGVLIMLLRYRLRKYLRLFNTSGIKTTPNKRKGN